MQIDIDELYSNIISPIVREFESGRSNLRHAYCAVWALDSFASHIFYCYKQQNILHQRSGENLTNDINFKNKALRPMSSDFAVIMDASAAMKHAIIIVRPGGKSVKASSDISSQKLEGWAAYFAGPDADDWGKQVIINNDEHLFKPLLPIVLRAETFLVTEKMALKNHLEVRRAETE